MSEGTFCDQCGQRLRGGYDYLRLEIVGTLAADLCDLACLAAWTAAHESSFARCAARRH